MRTPSLLFTSFILSATSLVLASPITYDVTVDTSSISGTPGSLDFNFNPGPLMTQAASLEILNFTTDGTLVPPAFPTGDVAGTLPGTLTFDNGTGFNDYFEDFTFGNSILFDVRLFGSALTAPNGTATSSSTFVFSMFSDSAGTIPALTTDTTDGFAFTVDVNLDGTTTVTTFSSQTTVVPETTSVPEPRTLPVLGIAIASMLVLVRVGKRAHQLTQRPR